MQNIQNKLPHILILLDCCHAAQLARDAGTILSSKVELLAACAMDVDCRPPGPRSFTVACIRVMRHLLRYHPYIPMSNLATKLTRREARLLQTPVHVVIRSGFGKRPIRLYPRRIGFRSAVQKRISRQSSK